MLKNVAGLALGLFAFTIVMGGRAAADSKCQGAKIKAAGKRAGCLLGLDAKQAAKGTAVDPTKCNDKFNAAYVKAETAPNDCSTTGDASAIQAKIDAWATELNVALTKGKISKCQGAKLKAASKKAKCLLGLDAKHAAKSSTVVDPTKCTDKYNAKFAKAETPPNDCSTTGDAAAVEDTIDNLADDVNCELDGADACDAACGTPVPTQLSFRTTVGTGNCGQVLDDSSALLLSLARDTLYTGGSGTTTPPAGIPDYGESRFKACCTGKKLLLGATHPGDPGITNPPRNCTGTNCLYGAPLPIVSPASVCVINKVAREPVGAGRCDTGSASIDIPLNSEIFLTLDILPRRCTGTTDPNDEGLGCKCNVTTPCPQGDCPSGTCADDSTDVQPCPICNSTTLRCNGGPNNGLACTPGTVSSTGPQFPTSHDCPPSAGNPLGTLAIPYALTTGSAVKTAIDIQPTGPQSHVFCGFCGSAPPSSVIRNPAVPCTADADCAAFTVANGGCGGANTSASCIRCRQLHEGAFTFGDARTITETGMPAGPISTTGGAANSDLVSVFCVPPTFNGVVDSAGDLPGPGAACLQGNMQLLGPPPPTTSTTTTTTSSTTTTT